MEMWRRLGSTRLGFNVTGQVSMFKYQLRLHITGPKRRWSLWVLFIAMDLQVRVFGPSDIVYIPTDHLYIRTFPLSGFMDRRSRYKRIKSHRKSVEVKKWLCQKFSKITQ